MASVSVPRQSAWMGASRAKLPAGADTMRLMFLSAGRYSPKAWPPSCIPARQKVHFGDRKPIGFPTLLPPSIRYGNSFLYQGGVGAGLVVIHDQGEIPAQKFCSLFLLRGRPTKLFVFTGYSGRERLERRMLHPGDFTFEIERVVRGQGSIWSVKAKGEQICCKLEPKRSPISRLAFTDVMDRG